ncbi:cytochrome c biogenesis protein CcdA [Sphingomonas suaedae]|uniref:Cytochrome c biogenesis protein CcdA n=1 Tax=Sphingomonas suaedae TaxID=2599297 RepID=A0A518RHL9_9SPHN|nr:cytochrome c biogenesis CcdA family protein [Sphingomonas suaedae]QDX26935.1 cytochrome c biogenesis protein CcdA [Sphingomonas suaedae]
MDSLLNPVLGFAAGALTILSPCVLPLIPIVLGSAAQTHRLGPFALAGGLVVSFTVVGFGLATVGSAIGIDAEVLRYFGAALLGLFGLALLVPQLRMALEIAAAPAASWAGARQDGLERHGLAGQAAIGALLGIVWSPCVGPTLGAATVLAADGQSLGAAAVVMFAFGLGIASVMLAIALAGRSVMTKLRSRLLHAGDTGRRLLGALLLVVAVAIGTGLDRAIEAVILDHSPDWLITVSTAF